MPDARVVACTLVAVAVLTVVTARPAPAEQTGWTRPVPGEVVRRFEPPMSRFGPGHLGVDLRAAAGTPVAAAGPGTVTYAGSVAGSLHVVVAHAGGLRTSYSFLQRVDVRRGETVQAGDVVGASGGAHADHHDRSVLHFGLRSGDTYVDPMLLFGTVDLSEVVHLAATEEPFGFTVAEERRGLLAGLRDRVGDLWDRTWRDGKRLVLGLPPTRAFGVAFALGKSVYSYARARLDCDPDAPPADGSGGSGHDVMVIAGIDSHTGPDGRTLDLPVERLGYEATDVSYYSYAADGGRYDSDDTHGSLLTAAEALGVQLRERQRRHPGEPVDLLAHSQGGVVALAFLELVYEPGDARYPPLGSVVTLASPLEGAPLAGALHALRHNWIARGLLDAADALPLPLPPTDAPAVRDLDPDSELMQRLADAPTPEHVELTSIGAAFDLMVPADVATGAGAEHMVVTTSAVDAHMAILRDADALRVTRAALEGRDLPCPAVRDVLAAELVPSTITFTQTLAAFVNEPPLHRVLR